MIPTWRLVLADSKKTNMNDDSNDSAENIAAAASASGDYGAEDIQALKGLEGIRHRPAMYIGDTTTAGLHHLVYELVDNCIDECANGFASHLSVVIHADGSVSVSDDGRGIPVGPMPEEDNKSALEVVLTNIHAGGKFLNRDSGGYKVGTGGLHGMSGSRHGPNAAGRMAGSRDSPRRTCLDDGLRAWQADDRPEEAW